MLLVAVLGFFVVTLDAMIVNVALPQIRDDLGGGITGLQWIADGYTLMFAALLLSAGVLVDRVGAPTAFTFGMSVFSAASVACGSAPTLGFLLVSRCLQGCGAAIMMPASMALISMAFPETAQRARAVALWATGGALASSSAPLLGGTMQLVSWRLIFFVNVPVAVVSLILLRRTTRPSTRSKAPFDWCGQVAAVITMGALVFSAIEAGGNGLTSPVVVISASVAVVATGVFVLSQLRGAHPMMPPSAFRSTPVRVSLLIGFTFMVGFFGPPFVISLFLQDVRGLSPVEAGLVFTPMMLVGLAITPLTHRIAARVGRRRLIATGLLSMAAGLVTLAAIPASAPMWSIAAALVLVGLAGPFVMPPTMTVLLDAVRSEHAGTVSGAFNATRQFGGALAVALFGALVAQPAGFVAGMRISLVVAAVLALVTAATSLLRLRAP